MIVKNEAAVIERCLTSVKPFIHSWAIADTGSSDGTQDTVRRCMAGIPGELIERPWVDFSTNRNQALELAKKHGDYALIIDADEVLEADASFTWGRLDAVGYLLELVYSGTRYRRVALPRLDLDWHWRGVLHEALNSERAAQAQFLPGLRILVYPDGARSQQSQTEKFTRDAEVLRRALIDEPGNARYQFYLAQSLRDAGNLADAIREYEKRVALGGWAEEVYFSKLQIAVLKERSGAPHAEIVAAYVDAFDYRPTRAEAPCDLARYLRLQQRYAVAFEFARIASNVARPDDVLFIDESVYLWRARDEQAVSAYWCGKREISAKLCRDLLAVLLVCAGHAVAQVTIPPASAIQLAGGKLNLNGADLQISGTLSIGPGLVTNANNITIAAGGLLDAGSGAINLSGNWSDLGSFIAGTSLVNFIDGGAIQAIFAGATTFYSASFSSTTGKNYLFPVGLTQTFTHSLTILGTAAQGIQFRSTAAGQAAFVNLQPSGTQNIDFVGVSNVHATGQPLAPTQTNDGGTGDAIGWFGLLAVAVAAVPAPLLSPLGLLLLGLLLMGLSRTFRSLSTR